MKSKKKTKKVYMILLIVCLVVMADWLQDCLGMHTIWEQKPWEAG